MSSFKDMVEADNRAVFTNADEFAEHRVVKYDGVTYAGEGEGIPVVLSQTKEMERPAITGKMEGLHLVSATAHIAQANLGGVVPEQKRDIFISDGEALGKPFFRRYRIVTSDCEMGMLVLELEGYDE